MQQPDVALTDYGLTLECAAFAALLLRERGGPLRRWFILFFVSLGAATLLGGTVHGFFPTAAHPAYRVLWPATLLALGVTAMAGWIIGARIQFSAPVARAIAWAVAVELVAYAAVVLFVRDSFAVAIFNYLPASVFFAGVLLLTYARVRERAVLAGLAGMLLTFVAAGVQQAKVGLHPVYFDHNALYHAVQAVALLLIFWSARWFVRS